MKNLILLIALHCFFSSCEEKPVISDSKEVFNEEEKCFPQNDTVIFVDSYSYRSKIIIRYPETKPVGTILALHGWNLPQTDWCDSSSFCLKALKKGYILILPDMGKSIYSFKNYPETRADWRRYPTREWMEDTLFQFLQNEFDLLQKKEKNFVLGISTGGRGAVLLGLNCPDIFKGIASLSGDYDQSAFPNDNLYMGYYGDYEQFPNRWRYQDNVVTNCRNLSTSLFIAHGEADEIVPIRHAQILVDALKKSSMDIELIYHPVPEAKHNYAFWDSQMEDILDFFDKL